MNTIKSVHLCAGAPEERLGTQWHNHSWTQPLVINSRYPGSTETETCKLASVRPINLRAKNAEPSTPFGKSAEIPALLQDSSSPCHAGSLLAQNILPSPPCELYIAQCRLCHDDCGPPRGNPRVAVAPLSHNMSHTAALSPARVGNRVSLGERSEKAARLLVWIESRQNYESQAKRRNRGRQIPNKYSIWTRCRNEFLRQCYSLQP